MSPARTVSPRTRKMRTLVGPSPRRRRRPRSARRCSSPWRRGGAAGRARARRSRRTRNRSSRRCAAWRAPPRRGAAGRPTSAPARAVIAVAMASLVGIADRGDKTPLGARCVARMAQMPLVVAPALESPRSVRGGFAPSCALLASLLRARKRELRRSAALVTASCASLLDVLRGWRRARRAEYPIGEESRATRASESRDDADDASSRAGTALAATYEAANAAGLDRYCAHLLADVVTACGADGVGAAAERAMRPGTFALLDACGDRELQQLHAAFGSQSGARGESPSRRSWRNTEDRTSTTERCRCDRCDGAEAIVQVPVVRHENRVESTRIGSSPRD